MHSWCTEICHGLKAPQMPKSDLEEAFNKLFMSSRTNSLELQSEIAS